MKKIILGILLLNLLAACSSNKPKEKVSEAAPAPATTAAAPAAATPATAETGTASTASTSTAPVAAESASSVAPVATSSAADASAAKDSAQENGSVYFPFDVDAVQEADRAAVQMHGAYLGKSKAAKVRVEGNADERGSSEYNLGLGQRRANNVKKLLIMSGARAAQIDTVSFGEEKPRCTEHKESCWSQNRRGDIIYTTK